MATKIDRERESVCFVSGGRKEKEQRVGGKERVGRDTVTHACTHTHAHTYTQTHTHTHARTHIRTPAYTHAYTYAHTPAYTHARARARTHARTHTHTYAVLRLTTHTALGTYWVATGIDQEKKRFEGAL